MARGLLALIIIFAALLSGGCSSPSFALVNIIMPGGRVSVSGVNHENEKSEAGAIPAALPKKPEPAVEKFSEILGGQEKAPELAPASENPPAWKPLN